MISRRQFSCGLVALPFAASIGHADGAAVLSSNGVAINGIDPVSYFAQGQPVRGRDTFQLMWRNVVWRFETSATQSAFERNPQRFAPRYGGYCAFSMATGAVSPTDPDAWAILDDKLYLAKSKAAIDAWKSDPATYVGQADTHWPTALCD
jgi:hypothetical protein